MTQLSNSPSVAAEAEAKIMSGDSPDEVVSHLIFYGSSEADAKAEVARFLRKRAFAIRIRGIGWIFVGMLCMGWSALCVLGILTAGSIPVKITISLVAISAFGFVCLMRGVFRILFANTQSGDARKF